MRATVLLHLYNRARLFLFSHNAKFRNVSDSIMVGRMGFEPMTTAVSGRYPNQLDDRPKQYSDVFFQFLYDSCGVLCLILEGIY